MLTDLQRKPILDRALSAKKHREEGCFINRDYQTELLLLADLDAKDTDIRKLHEDLNRLADQKNQFVELTAMLISLWEHDKWERDNPAIVALIKHGKQLLLELPADSFFNMTQNEQTPPTTHL